MKTILIYGPPASGKLTIAQELEKQTGYFLFHNHLVVDFVKNLLSFNTEEFWSVCLDIRKRLVSAYKEEKDGLIMTLVYEKNDKSLIDHIQKESEFTLFVQLTCSEKTLFNRVENSSRKEFHKISSQDVLSDFLLKNSCQDEISQANHHMKIDTDILTPQQASQAIIAYLKNHKT